MTPTTTTATSNKTNPTIPVVIVESHQHVLEHVHDVLRKKRLFQQAWSMVHFDAHPDLACTKVAPAAACFAPRQYYCDSSVDSCARIDKEAASKNNANSGSGSGSGSRSGSRSGGEPDAEKEEAEADTETNTDTDKKNLYELLDLTPSGIAEWIMPLVLAANLNKIEWIKPAFSKQISEGIYRFDVGVERPSNSITRNDSNNDKRGNDNDNDNDNDNNNNNNNNNDNDNNGNKDSGDCHPDEITSFVDLPETARVKVDFHHPYYLDDASVVPSDRLVLKQTVELRVTQLQQQQQQIQQHEQQHEQQLQQHEQQQQYSYLGRQETKAANDRANDSDSPLAAGDGDFDQRGGGPTERRRTRQLGENDPEPWVLDICLDYFACQNPYILDLERKSPSASRAFLNVMRSSKFGSCVNDSDDDDDNNNNSIARTDNNQPASMDANIAFDYQTEIVRFYDLLKTILSSHCDSASASSKDAKRRRQTLDPDCDAGITVGAVLFERIAKYFDGKDRAEALIRTLVKEINESDNESDNGNGNGNGNGNAKNDKDNKARTRLLPMILEAIPNHGMPHERFSSHAGATLAMRESLCLVERYIQQQQQQQQRQQHLTEIGDHRQTGKPFLVTIARSTLDGFCPPSVVEDLQASVLEILHRQLCGRDCQSCRQGDNTDRHRHRHRCQLQLVRDYGEWEGSTIYGTSFDALRSNNNNNNNVIA